MLANDPQSVACEIPTWVEPREIDQFTTLFGARGPLTGHIDLLRMDQTGRIGVWDYKPGADSERTAHLQIMTYALALSIRTGIPLNRFTCGYFDETCAFVFDPA
jgi:hypothetical protein